MHLMYTLDAEGNRVYTLKVSPGTLFVSERLTFSLQKVTDSGKITKSAHPGSYEQPCFARRRAQDFL